jgi:hypothetical protein
MTAATTTLAGISSAVYVLDNHSHRPEKDGQQQAQGYWLRGDRRVSEINTCFRTYKRDDVRAVKFR